MLAEIETVRQVADAIELDVRLTLAAVRNERFSEVEWAGVVPLPDPGSLEPGDRLRVRIAEYEVHEADSTWLAPVILGVPPRGRRLVYADSVDLP